MVGEEGFSREMMLISPSTLLAARRCCCWGWGLKARVLTGAAWRSTFMSMEPSPSPAMMARASQAHTAPSDIPPTTNPLVQEAAVPRVTMPQAREVKRVLVLTLRREE